MMTEDEMTELGAQAEMILSDAGFQTLYGLFENGVATQMVATKPSEREQREQFYSELTGARSFVEFMKDAVLTARRIQERNDPSVEDIDDPAVHNIY